MVFTFSYGFWQRSVGLVLVFMLIRRGELLAVIYIGSASPVLTEVTTRSNQQ